MTDLRTLPRQLAPLDAGGSAVADGTYGYAVSGGKVTGMAAAGGGSAVPARPGFKSGHWQNSSMDFGSVSSAGGTAGRLYILPLIVAYACTLDRIGMWTVTTGASVARLGIYNSGSGGQPGTRLLDAGTISNATTTGAKEITISQALTPGIYWLACLIESTGGSWRFNDSSPGVRLLGRDSTMEGSYATSLIANSVSSGSLPTPAPTLTIATGDSPRIAVRVA